MGPIVALLTLQSSPKSALRKQINLYSKRVLEKLCSQPSIIKVIKSENSNILRTRLILAGHACKLSLKLLQIADYIRKPPIEFIYHADSSSTASSLKRWRRTGCY